MTTGCGRTVIVIKGFGGVWKEQSSDHRDECDKKDSLQFHETIQALRHVLVCDLGHSRKSRATVRPAALAKATYLTTTVPFIHGCGRQ